MMNFSSQRLTTGFSLIETLVAITILLLVVVGPLSISSRTAKSANFASEQTIAHFLAQEGLELAQKGRDDLVLQYLGTATSPWDEFTDPSGAYAPCYTVSGCGLSIRSSGVTGVVDVTNCATANACALWESTTTARPIYRHSSTGAVSTPYTRAIKFVVDGEEVKAVSEVTWRTGTILANQRVLLETYLFNVYDNP